MQYIQRVKLNVRRIDESRSSLTLLGAGKPEPLVRGGDAYIKHASRSRE